MVPSSQAQPILQLRVHGREPRSGKDHRDKAPARGLFQHVPIVLHVVPGRFQLRFVGIDHEVILMGAEDQPRQPSASSTESCPDPDHATQPDQAHHQRHHPDQPMPALAQAQQPRHGLGQATPATSRRDHN